MLILGLTGQSGAGKGYVAALFAKHHLPSIDCDAVSREVCAPNAPCTVALAQAFGSDVLDGQGALLRRELAKRAFATPEATETLNRVTHPFILDALHAKMATYEKQGCHALLLDAPTLLESGLDRQCDRIIVVTAPRALRRVRIRARDGLTEAEADLRLDAQKEEAFYLASADFVIVNDNTTDCESQVRAVLEHLSLIL